MMDHFESIRDMLAKDDVQSAIERLRELIVGQSRTDGPTGRRFRDLANEITVESGEWRGLVRDRRRGAVDPDQIERRERRAKARLLELVDEAAKLMRRLEGPVAPDMVPLDIASPKESALEKIWGRNTLQNVAWLEKGIAASSAVCRIVTPRSLGTGFLIGNGRIVTNYHVLANSEVAAQTVVEFNFEEDSRGRMQTVYSYPAVAEGFATSAGLDCSVVRLAEVDGAPPLSSWGALSLNGGAELEIGQHVSIVQHPNGGQKKISVTANEIVNLFDQLVHYMTDTMPGSSGAPVFDDAWTVVALHRAGGNMMKNDKGERIFANEGVRIRDILDEPNLARALAI